MVCDEWDGACFLFGLEKGLWQTLNKNVRSLPLNDHKSAFVQSDTVYQLYTQAN